MLVSSYLFFLDPPPPPPPNRSCSLDLHYYSFSVDRDSYILLWELLILLLRQKSAIDGCDIAELLLKDREDFHKPYATHSQTSTFARNSDSENKESCSNIEEDDLSEYNTEVGRDGGGDTKLVVKVKQER